MPTKELMVSKAEYDDMARAVILLDLILNARGTCYDLERIVNHVRAVVGMETHEEENSNA